MTVVCGGGSSSARPGFGASVAITASGLAATLNNIGTPWAVALASYIGLVTYELATFCNTDPPPVPVISAADYLALLTYNNIIAHTAAVAKFQQLVAAFVWYDFCQCDSVSTPAPPAPPAAPVGLPVLNPPSVTPRPNAAPCLEEDYGTLHIAGVATQQTYLPYFGALRVTAIELDVTTVHVPGTGNSIDIFLEQTGYQADGSNPGVRRNRVSVSGDEHQTFLFTPAPSADAGIITFVGTVSAATDTAIHLIVRYWCSGQQPGTPTETCPPDPLVRGMLDQILQLVTLIQRQAVPFAYVPRTIHSGLSGSGQLAVQGLIGAEITITANAPGTIGVQTGDPEYLWDAGWINWGSADGFTPRQFLSATTTLSLPPSAGAYTLLGYSLAPGVVVTIRELAREP